MVALILAAAFGFLLGVVLMALLAAGREEESLTRRLEAVEAARRAPPTPTPDAAGRAVVGHGRPEGQTVSVSSERDEG